MKSTKITLFTLPLLLASAQAEELTLKPSLFEIKTTIHAQAMPIKKEEIQITPLYWQKYSIESIVPQGKWVEQGQTLIQFNKEELKKEWDKQLKEHRLRKIRLEEVKQEYQDLSQKNAQIKDKVKTLLKRQKEDQKHFVDTEEPLIKKTQQQFLKNADFNVMYYEEELRQLRKMYKEDDLTEETEEIILKRAEHSLKRTLLDRENIYAKVKRELEVNLPRKKKDWQTTLVETSLQQHMKLQQSKRAVARKKISLEKEESVYDQWEKHLDKLKHDLDLMTLKANKSGYVYYGEFNKAKWNFSAEKQLCIAGKPVKNRTLITLVPKYTDYVFTASVNASKRHLLKNGQQGTAKLQGTYKTGKFTVQNLDDQQFKPNYWLVNFTANLPTESFIQPGMTVSIELPIYRKENALLIPISALDTSTQPHTVNLKQTDGTVKKQPVKTGKFNENKIEIVDGLKEGDILTF